MKYEKFKKMDKKDHSQVTRLLKQTTHLTAREWVIARLCADFKNAGGRSEMTWIGKNLPELVPFCNEPYTRQEVSNARASFINKLERSGTTLFYSYYSGLISKKEMLDILEKITANISILLDMEERDTHESHVEEVQGIMLEVLRRINEELDA